MHPVDILSAVEISIPLNLVISYVATISICLLLGRIQLGLAVSFLFVFILDTYTTELFYLTLLKALPWAY
jgi:hypothetical protein